jgi:hypothetical protein
VVAHRVLAARPSEALLYAVGTVVDATLEGDPLHYSINKTRTVSRIVDVAEVCRRCRIPEQVLIEQPGTFREDGALIVS